ncbi:Patatin-like protein 6 [Asimina triloba]
MFTIIRGARIDHLTRLSGVRCGVVKSLGAAGCRRALNSLVRKVFVQCSLAHPVQRVVSTGCVETSSQASCLLYTPCFSLHRVMWVATGPNLGHCSANTDSDPSPSNVNMLIGMAEEMLKQKNVESVLFGGKRIGDQTNYEKLDWFAGELVLEHQRRSCRIAPTVAFKQPTSRTA